MKIKKIENRITYFIITTAIFLLNIKNLSFLSILSGTLLSILFILLFEKTKIYKFKLTKIVLFITSIIFMILNLNKITYFISDNILREYSTIAIGFSILTSIYILGNKGYHTITKVILLASYFIFLFFIIGFLTTFIYIDFTNLNISILNTTNILNNSLYYAFLITYTYFLIYPTTNTKFKIKDLLITTTYQIITYILIFLISGNTLFNLYQYPYILIYKTVDLIDFIERIEIIFSMNYLFTFYFLILISYYQIKFILESKIKKDKKLKLILIFISFFIFFTSIAIF